MLQDKKCWFKLHELMSKTISQFKMCLFYFRSKVQLSTKIGALNTIAYVRRHHQYLPFYALFVAKRSLVLTWEKAMLRITLKGHDASEQRWGKTVFCPKTRALMFSSSGQTISTLVNR